MRTARIAGIALIAVGAAILFWGGTFTSRRNVLEVGGLTVTAEEERRVPPWAAPVALIVGFALLVYDFRRVS